MKYLVLLASLMFSPALFGQIQDPVHWVFESRHIKGNEFELTFKAKIDDGWKTYSPFQEYGEDAIAPIPTGIYYDEGTHFEAVGKLMESGNRKVAAEPLFDNLNVAYFTKNATFTQRVKVLDASKPITGYVESMACNDEMCLPPSSTDFSLLLEIPATTGQNTEPPVDENIAAAVEEHIDKPKEDFTEVEQLDALEAVPPPTDIEAPLKWTFDSKKVGEQEYELLFIASLEKGWTFYSQHTSPENGPVPTEFHFEKSGHFELLGPAREEGGKKKSGIDPFFGVNVVKFTEGPVTFTQRVRVLDSNLPITGYLTYMACDDSECLPPTDVDFSFGLAAGVAGQVQAFDPASGLKAIDQTVPSIRATYVEPLGNCGEENVARNSSLLWTFILGFAGGLLALLTPCVFPMIPLTVSFFTKSSQDRASGIRNALLYGLSIIVIYVSIGLMITAFFGEDALNLLSTNWIANTLFFIIFIAFAFSFFGFYEITLPSSWANKSDSMADRGGLLGIFFMAFTLAIVSFSCTGPIIGSALVQSATDKLGPFIVMLGFSSALALPFALFAAFPGWLNSLPKSGGWMNSVKVVLGFLELALALKFLSVADMTMHWNILPYEVFMGAWVLIFAAMTAYLFGFIRFPHDSPVQKLTATRGTFSFLSLALTIYLATGFFYNENTKSYNSLKLMSGLAPPATYNVFLPDTNKELDTRIKDRYPSFTKCANNLDCFKNYEEGVAYAKEVNKPILLDFTGYGCVNCRKTEEHIWVADEVKQKLSEEFVLVSLYVDDRKALKETLLSVPRQEKLRNVGNKWADFQIVNFEQNSQPLYVMMSPDERVLAAPRGYKEGVKEYAEFLECGLNTYEQVTEDKKKDKQDRRLGVN
ncbi:MAG: thioredoxin family protein [Phaeodactylibacter sp.]|nr:thioredoxin family protein [Phaeodactylibacter sp.]MCB9266880.1 thioredoxin family protein [Lewinellaceae bacterium]MCB9290150.1 thioredoxin family protein [Lewinellaceae bacterium]